MGGDKPGSSHDVPVAMNTLAVAKFLWYSITRPKYHVPSIAACLRRATLFLKTFPSKCNVIK